MPPIVWALLESRVGLEEMSMEEGENGGTVRGPALSAKSARDVALVASEEKMKTACVSGDGGRS